MAKEGLLRVPKPFHRKWKGKLGVLCVVFLPNLKQRNKAKIGYRFKNLSFND